MADLKYVPFFEEIGIDDVPESVLTDPNLHTDTRARLHWEIRELLAAHAVEDRQ